MSPDEEGHYSRALIAFLQLLGGKKVVSARRSATTLGGRRRGHLGATSLPGHAAGGGAAPQTLKEPKHAHADVGVGLSACTCVCFRTCGETPPGLGPLARLARVHRAGHQGPGHPRAFGDGLLAGRGQDGIACSWAGGWGGTALDGSIMGPRPA